MQIHQIAPKNKKKQKRQIHRPWRKTRHLFGARYQRPESPSGKKNEAGNKRLDKEIAQKERLQVQIVPKRFGYRQS